MLLIADCVHLPLVKTTTCGIPLIKLFAENCVYNLINLSVYQLRMLDNFLVFNRNDVWLIGICSELKINEISKLISQNDKSPLIHQDSL